MGEGVHATCWLCADRYVFVYTFRKEENMCYNDQMYTHKKILCLFICYGYQTLPHVEIKGVEQMASIHHISRTEFHLGI